MSKKLVLLTVLAIFVATGISIASPKKGRMVANPRLEGLKTLMFFKAVKDSREKLNLNEKQNVALDRILREVEDFTVKLKEEKKNNNFMDSFVNDSFDPFKFEEEKEKKREQVKSFYLSKIKAIHDLLTKEQRETLIKLMKEKAMRMKKFRKRRDRKIWMEKRNKQGMHTPRNY